MTNTEASGTVSERQRSGKFLGDGSGKDSRIVFEKKEHRRSFGSGNSYRSKSEEGTLGAVGREEIRINNGSYSSPNGRRYNATRTRSFGSGNSYRSKSEEGTLDAFGREEIRTNNGSYSSTNGRRSNATRSRSFGSGNSYRSK
ncbi:stress protein DDR48-like [Macadamia integrifolia]|uniref:stress protein DDR48-like n=1 Tax=Macadamia integrifolia TaxID=60698 RepID=UPI001C4F8C01|nr:stress protein DDR48-like [Macadamia integrifolia]